MSGISRDEWLKALTDAGLHETDDQEAVTVPEFAAMFGLDRQTADRRLKRLEAIGKATRVRKRAPAAGRDGRMCWYVAFRLVT